MDFAGKAQSQLAKIALRWMLIEAESKGLQLDPQRKADILGAKKPYVAPDPLTVNQHKPLHGVWWIAEFWPKIVPVQNDQKEWKKHLRINLGRCRTFPPNPLVHESVDQQLKGSDFPYHPPNLPTPYTIVKDGSSRAATA